MFQGIEAHSLFPGDCGDFSYVGAKFVKLESP